MKALREKSDPDKALADQRESKDYGIHNLLRGVLMTIASQCEVSEVECHIPLETRDSLLREDRRGLLRRPSRRPN